MHSECGGVNVAVSLGAAAENVETFGGKRSSP